MPATALRLLIAAWVLVALGRAAGAAWRHRSLATTVWGRIRPYHVAGALGLLAAVLAASLALLQLVPVTRVGLGTLVDFSGNAVFTPLDAAARSSPAGPGEPNWLLAILGTLFLGLLAALLPWLAFVEEEVFRAGLEAASRTREVLTALVFGAAHLVMLVPVAAALAIAVVGFVYGRIYRRAYARADAVDLPGVAREAFRPTKRSATAADEAREPAPDTGATVAPDTGATLPVDSEATLPVDSGATLPVDSEATLPVDRTPELRQIQAVLASTVWHTTFNSTVIVLVWISVLGAALTTG